MFIEAVIDFIYHALQYSCLFQGKFIHKFFDEIDLVSKKIEVFLVVTLNCSPIVEVNIFVAALHTIAFSNKSAL